MNVFLDSNSELRSGWKFIAFLLIFAILFIAIAVLLSALLQGREPPNDELIILGLNVVLILVPVVAALLLVVRFIEHKPLSTFGIGFYPGWRRDLFGGLAVAGVMLVLLMAGCAVLGDLDVQWTAGLTSGGRHALTVLLLMMAAANEELLFRGYPLQTLRRAIGTWPAVLVLSGIFGWLHMDNPNASMLGGINTVVAGILLSIAYLQTRWLWLPFGIHIGWNAGIGWIFGFPLSGLDIASLWTSNVAGNPTVVGGGYGPEEGLLGTFIFAVSIIIVKKGFSK